MAHVCVIWSDATFHDAVVMLPMLAWMGRRLFNLAQTHGHHLAAISTVLSLRACWFLGLGFNKGG